MLTLLTTIIAQQLLHNCNDKGENEMTFYRHHWYHIGLSLLHCSYTFAKCDLAWDCTGAVRYASASCPRHSHQRPAEKLLQSGPRFSRVSALAYRHLLPLVCDHPPPRKHRRRCSRVSCHHSRGDSHGSLAVEILGKQRITVSVFRSGNGWVCQTKGCEHQEVIN